MIYNKLKQAIHKSEYTEVISWGSNSHGQLGLLQQMPKIMDLGGNCKKVDNN